MSASGAQMQVSPAFIQKQAEIQRKLEFEVTEIKKIEQGRSYILVLINYCYPYRIW